MTSLSIILNGMIEASITTLCSQIEAKYGIDKKDLKNMWNEVKEEKVKSKRGKTGYLVFCQEKRKDLQAQGLSFGQISKELGKEWKALNEKEKKEYNDRAKNETEEEKIDRLNRETERKANLIRNKVKAMVENNISTEDDQTTEEMRNFIERKPIWIVNVNEGWKKGLVLYADDWDNMVLKVSESEEFRELFRGKKLDVTRICLLCEKKRCKCEINEADWQDIATYWFYEGSRFTVKIIRLSDKDELEIIDEKIPEVKDE